MINIQDFLMASEIEVGCYTLVTYNNKTEAIYFSKYKDNGRTWFLESPCECRIVDKVIGDKIKFCQEHVRTYYSIKGGKKGIVKFSKEYIEPLVVDDILYEVENYQCSPFLPKEVDNIEIISERDCLLYILNRLKEEA